MSDTALARNPGRSALQRFISTYGQEIVVALAIVILSVAVTAVNPRFLSDTTVLLLAMPIGLAGLGAMADMGEARFRDAAHGAMRILLYAGVPLSLALVLHGEAVVRLAFARGAFGADSIAVTAAIIQAAGVGLWAQLMGYAGAKFLSARGRNARVILIYAAAFGCNIALNLLLAPRLGAAALGVAGAVNSVVFGLFIVKALGLLELLSRDLLTVAALAATYLLAWRLLASPAADAGWPSILGFVTFWSAALLLVPRCRQVLQGAWLSLRAA